MIDFGKSDKMIKVSGKVDKPTLTTVSAILIFRFLLKKELHFLPLKLYIHLQAPPPPVDIMLAMFSWLLQISLHIEYLTYPLRTYHHRLQ